MKSHSRHFGASNKNTMPVLWALVGMAWAAVLALSSITSVDTLENFQQAHFLLLGYVALVIFILRMASTLDVRESIVLLYGIGYAVFHFGIMPIYAIAPRELENLGFNLVYWYTDYQTVLDAYFSAAIFLAGICTALLVPMRATHRQDPEGHSGSMLSRPAFFGLVLSVLVWLAIVFSAGFGAYDILVEGLTSSGRAGAIGVVHTAIGLTFIFSVADHRIRRRGLLVYGAWAMLAFSLGLRGEVAFPGLVAFGILASQGVVRVNLTRLIAIAVLFLVLSSAVAVTRISTSDASFLGSVSVVKGIAELGGSIRPSYEVLRWLESGDTLRMGETYYAPFERLFLRVFPLWDRLPARQDYRLMNVLISERAGPYGFSISAEAYYNFGKVGPAVVGFLAAVILRRMGRQSPTKNVSVVLTALSLALFIHIRQDFVTSWSALLYSLIIIVFLKLSARART